MLYLMNNKKLFLFIISRVHVWCKVVLELISGDAIDNKKMIKQELVTIRCWYNDTNKNNNVVFSVFAAVVG